MRLCVCPQPVRSLENRDRLICTACDGYTSYGHTPAPDKLRRQARYAATRLLHLAEEYRWACEYVPRRPEQNGRSSNRPDPTGNLATDEQLAQVAAWRNIAAHLLVIVIDAADRADAALGEARYAADPGPQDHVRAPYHDAIPANRPDLVEAHAAKARRRARGEL